MNDLNFLELQKEQFPSLDYLITENEIFIAAKKLQNNKSAFSDKRKNEMIKASIQEMMPAYLKLFNSILTSGIMPNTWCRGLITPISVNQEEEMNHHTTEEFVSPAVWENNFVLF